MERDFRAVCENSRFQVPHPTISKAIKRVKVLGHERGQLERIRKRTSGNRQLIKKVYPVILKKNNEADRDCSRISYTYVHSGTEPPSLQTQLLTNAKYGS